MSLIAIYMPTPPDSTHIRLGSTREQAMAWLSNLERFTSPAVT